MQFLVHIRSCQLLQLKRCLIRHRFSAMYIAENVVRRHVRVHEQFIQLSGLL